MRSTANTFDQGVGHSTRVLTYKATKFNKESIEYQCTSELGKSIFNSNLSRLEVNRGYSRATGCPYFFKVKTESSWSNCSNVTGVYPTSTNGVFFGDIKHGITKTMILFKVDEHDFSELTIYVYPNGRNPRQYVNKIASLL